MDALLARHPVDDQGRPLDVIELRGMRVRCIVGVYPRERTTPQPLEVDIALYLDTRAAAAKGALSRTVDYGRLEGELRFLLESAWFQLLEPAADALCRYILAPPTADQTRAPVKAVTVRLSKPEALPQGAIASLIVHRTEGEYAYAQEHKPFGQVDIVYEDEAVGIYRLRLKPGGVIDTHEHRLMDESELVLGTGLLLQGEAVLAGTAFRWPKNFAHRYDNPQSTEQTILCVDRPRFIADDEVSVPAPEGGLARVEGVQYYPDGATVVAPPRGGS